MNDLLKWVKSNIKTDLTVFKKVKILPDKFFVPDKKGFPSVGIIDGGIERKNFKVYIKEQFKVEVVVYQSIMKDEASIIGDAQRKGVESLMKDVFDLFKNKFPTGYYNINRLDESPIQAVTKDFKRFVVMKTIDLIFYRMNTEV
jgi:hypothetical protein